MRKRAAITYSANQKQVVIDCHVRVDSTVPQVHMQRIDTAIVVPRPIRFE